MPHVNSQRLTFYGLLAFALLHPSATTAEEKQSYPSIEGELTIELQNDRFFKSDDSANEINDLSPTVEVQLKFNFNKNLSFTAQGNLESIGDSGPNKDRFFNRFSLFAEELFLEYKKEAFLFKGGMFTPHFGKAWDEAPGIYGTDFAEDYELSERIGFELGWTFSGKQRGEHTLKASTFFLDRSALSQSVFKNRGQTRSTTGEPSNTADLSSFAVALDGAFAQLQNLNYHLGYSDQAKGQGNNSRQRGIAGALTYQAKVGPFNFIPLLEIAYFDGWEGTDDQESLFLTAGFATEWKDWRLNLTYTDRTIDKVTGSDADDFLFQATVGYDFGCKLPDKKGCIEIETGYRLTEEDNIESHAWGLFVKYNFNFAHVFK